MSKTLCPDCGKTWSGSKICHCGACHATFTTLGNFDRHRKTGSCVQPESIGLHKGPNGNYRSPGNPGRFTLS